MKARSWFYLRFAFLTACGVSPLSFAAQPIGGNLALIRGEGRVRPSSPSYFPIVDDFLVNDDTTSYLQRLPSIAMDGRGYLIVAWQDFRDDHGQEPDVYAQRYDSLGNPLGSNFPVNDTSFSHWRQHWDPSVGANGRGDFTIVWTFCYSNGGPDEDIHGQRYDSLGNALGPDFRVNDIQESYQRESCIAMKNSGASVVVFGSCVYNSNWNILARRYDSSGNPRGPSFRVTDDPDSSDQVEPHAAMSESGAFVVCWRDDRFGALDHDIYAQLYDSLGNPVGSNVRVNDDPGGVRQYFPSCAMDARGDFVVAWEDTRNGYADIYAQRYDFRGNPVGANFRVTDDSDSDWQYWTSAAMDDSGNSVITWVDGRRGGTGTCDIYAQRYHSDGTPWGVNYKVDTDFSSDKCWPDVAVDTRRIYFAWADERRAGEFDIWAKMVDWEWTGVGVEEAPNDQFPMTNFQLMQNHPNPFCHTTTLEFSITNDQCPISLKVYDVRGRLVRTLVNNEPMTPSSPYGPSGPRGNSQIPMSVVWDGRDDGGRRVGAGVYFYRLTVGDFAATRKLVVLR